MDREHLMSRWDAWRQYIAGGGKGSWPRDEFEMLLDYFMEPKIMDFEKWWSNHPITKSTILPIMKMSFKELAKSAWEAALYNNPCACDDICGPRSRDCKDCPHGGSNEL